MEMIANNNFLINGDFLVFFTDYLFYFVFSGLGCSFQSKNTDFSLSIRFTTIALLALIKFSGVIMISSPH